MANPQYFIYPGLGEFGRENIHYSQAVRVGDRIETSGQGGWNDPTRFPKAISDIKFPIDLMDEIDQAFKNVDIALKAAGGKGWSQVYRINSYHIGITPEVTAQMAANFQKWMPDHHPIWTEIGVAELGLDGMRVEIEVSAYNAAVSK